MTGGVDLTPPALAAASLLHTRRAAPLLIAFSLGCLPAQTPPKAASDSLDRLPVWRSVLEWVCENDPERRYPMFLSPRVLTDVRHGGRLDERYTADRLDAPDMSSLTIETCLAPHEPPEANPPPFRSTIHLTLPRPHEGHDIAVQVLLRGVHPSEEGPWSWSKSTFYFLSREAGGWTVVGQDLDWVTN